MNKLVKPLIEVIEINDSIISTSGPTRTSGTGSTETEPDGEVED